MDRGTKGELRGLIKMAKQLGKDLEEEDVDVKKIMLQLRRIDVGVDLANKKIDEILKAMGISIG